MTNLVRREKETVKRTNGVIICSKCNNRKNVSRKHLQKLINKQTERDRQSMLQGQVNEIVSWKLPEKKSYISFHVPTMKGIICIPMETKLGIVFLVTPSRILYHNKKIGMAHLVLDAPYFMRERPLTIQIYCSNYA